MEYLGLYAFEIKIHTEVRFKIKKIYLKIWITRERFGGGGREKKTERDTEIFIC